MVPGRKFSTITSVRSRSDSSTGRTDGFLRSSVRLSLLRLMLRKYALSPFTNGGPHARVSSPLPGCSILITRAPMSARSIVQYGPDRTRVRSRTVIPWRGPIEDADAYYRLRRKQLTHLRAGERVAFTSGRGVYREECRRRRGRVRRAPGARLAHR